MPNNEPYQEAINLIDAEWESILHMDSADFWDWISGLVPELKMEEAKKLWHTYLA